MDKKAIIFFGPPGSGKGTQAGLLLSLLKNHYEHFDSGSVLEKMIHNEKLVSKDPAVKKARQAFLSGKIVDPLFVVGLSKAAAMKAAKKNKGIVFTGSPRTVLEAEGTKKIQGLLPKLEELYGRDNIIVILLDIPMTESVKRNSKRGRPGLDEPSIIKIRYREYQKRTYPIIQALRRRNIKVQKINGRPPIKVVFNAVLKALTKCGLQMSKSSKIVSTVKK